MARFNFRHPLRSIGNFVRDIVTGRPERREPPEPIPTPPEPPPRPPIDYPPVSNYDYNDTRADIFREVTGDSGSSFTATEFWDLFSNTGIPGGTDYFNTNEAWNEFLRSFYLKSSEAGSIRRQEFYDDWDISAELIDWDHWRELIDTP